MFYDRMKQICAENETTVTTLLKELNLSTSMTGNFKRGSLPNGETLIKLSRALNISVDYLLGLTENPEVNK